MKLLHLNVALVIFTFCSVNAGSQVVSNNQDLTDTIRSLLETVENLQEEVAELRKSVNDNEDLRETIKSLQGEVENDKQMNADTLFMATISNYTKSVLPGDPIVWDSAPINPGGHYSTVLGTYTAPVTGCYQFSVVKHGNYYSGAFYILVDEVRYVFVNEFANSNSKPLGSATINIQLTAGQVVRIENDWSTTIYGTNSGGYIYSWFTGHLLYAL